MIADGNKYDKIVIKKIKWMFVVEKSEYKSTRTAIIYQRFLMFQSVVEKKRQAVDAALMKKLRSSIIRRLSSPTFAKKSKSMAIDAKPAAMFISVFSASAGLSISSNKAGLFNLTVQ